MVLKKIREVSNGEEQRTHSPQSLLLYISHPLRTYTTLDILYILRYTDTLLSLKL